MSCPRGHRIALGEQNGYFCQISSNTTIELHAGLGIAEVDWRGDGDLCTVLARQP